LALRKVTAPLVVAVPSLRPDTPRPARVDSVSARENFAFTTGTAGAAHRQEHHAAATTWFNLELFKSTAITAARSTELKTSMPLLPLIPSLCREW
jgi:hypothetical protein